MKKLLLIFTFLLAFPLKALAQCENFSHYTLSSGNMYVSYVKSDGTSGSTYTSNSTSSLLLPVGTKSINYVTKNISTTFSTDIVVFQGSLEFISWGDSSWSSVNPNLPNVNNIPAPVIATSSDYTVESYCEFLNISLSSSNNYLQDPGSSSTTLLTPRLSSFNFTLKCHRHQNFPTTSANYRLMFYLGFNLFPDTSMSLNSDYYINSSFRNSLIGISDACSNDDIIGAIQSLGSDVTEIKDTIQDTDITGAVTEVQNQLEDWGVNYHGVAGFVTAPLSFITSLANQQACTPIPLPPILGSSSTFLLPCFMEEFEDRFPSLFAIYQIAIYFFVCYRIGIDCFKLIQKLKDPLNDEISVADI